jgi:class 3 adenylate cyclase
MAGIASLSQMRDNWQRRQLPCFTCNLIGTGAIPVNDDPLMPSDPASPSGERRQVTVLFADMVGFTAISEQLGGGNC